MTRREFVLGSATTFAAGCGSKSTPTAAFEPDWLTAQAREREEHLKRLERSRVPVDAVRTTPKSPFSAPELFPELKPLMKIAYRLHPRYGEEPAPDASKIGGRFAAEPFEINGIPAIPVLQLRIEDAPPNLRFEPDTDLMQLFWSPTRDRELPPTIVIAFRSTKLPAPTPPVPGFDRVPAGLVPVPCRIVPERIAEYPPPDLMPKMMRDRVAAWKEPRYDISGAALYLDMIGPAPGTKIGGWPRLRGEPTTPTCSQCKRLMDYILTIDAVEWDAATAPAWRPVEEIDLAEIDGYRTAIGLDFGPDRRAVHVYVCGSCAGYKAKAIVV